MLIALQVALIFLKFTVLTSVSWWLVLLPLLVVVGFWIGAAILVGIATLFVALTLD